MMDADRLRVGVDVFPLRPPLTGIGYYQLYLLSAISRLAAAPVFVGFGRRWRPVNEGFLSSICALRAAPSRSSALISLKLARALAGHSSLVRRLSIESRRFVFERTPATPASLSLFHAFGYVPPGRIKAPVIPVVYDVSFVRFPESHPKQRLKALEGLERWVKQAPVVHTISEFSASEIAEVFSIPRSKVQIIYPGVRPQFISEDVKRTDLTLKRFELRPKKYFLSVSTLEPRKNLRTLIEAYSCLSQSIRRKIPLCIVGASGWGDLRLPKSAEMLKQEGSLRFLGYVPEIDLQALYAQATAFLYPSFYEGFGMPVIEALSCGTPVVCADAASLREAGAAVARYAPPFDVAAWMQEMERAAEPDDDPIGRVERAEAVARFNWQTAAQQTCRMYLSALGQGVG